MVPVLLTNSNDIAEGRGANHGLGDLVRQAALDDGYMEAGLGQAVANGVTGRATPNHDVVKDLFIAQGPFDGTNRSLDEALHERVPHRPQLLSLLQAKDGTKKEQGTSDQRTRREMHADRIGSTLRVNIQTAGKYLDDRL